MAGFDYERGRQLQTEVNNNWDKIIECEQEALAAYKREEYASAVEAYTQALQYFPSHELMRIAYPTQPSNVWGTFLVILNNRGLAYCNSGNYRKAIDDFNSVLSELPSHSDALYHRGLAKRNLGDFHDAIADFNEVLADKEDAYAYNERGIAFAELGRMPEAIADYRSALRVDPNHTPARNNLRRDGGLVPSNQDLVKQAAQLLAQGEKEAAKGVLMQVYLHLLTDSPFDNRPPTLPINENDLQAVGVSINEFMMLCNELPGVAKPSSKKSASEMTKMGCSYCSRKEFEKALELFDGAIVLDGSFVDAWFSKAGCLYELGRIQEAKECYRKVLQLNPFDIQAKEALQHLG